MKTAIVVTATVVGLSGAAMGQVTELGVHAGAHRMQNADLGGFGDGTNIKMNNSWLFGFRVTLNNYRFFGHEMGYAYNRTKWLQQAGGQTVGEAGTAIHRGFYNFLVYATPEGSVVRPFAGAGGHFHNYVFPGYSGVSGGGSTKFGLNYGGGIKVRVSHMFGIRLDVHNYWNGKPFGDLFLNQTGKVQQLEVSAGFSLLL